MMRFILVLLALLLAGCGSEFSTVPVSGVVTLDGQPLEGVEVIFAPAEDKDKVQVGPASVGVTDSDGKFTLKTVKGDSGAVVTQHRVSIALPEVSEAEIAAKVDEAVNKNRSMSEAKVAALEKRVRRSLMKSKPLPESYNRKSVLRFDVTEATDQANFDLKSDGS